MIGTSGVEQVARKRFGGSDSEIFKHLHLAEKIAAPLAQLLHRSKIILIGGAQTGADLFQISDEVDELVVEFRAAIHDVAHAACLHFLLPKNIDDADDVKQSGGAHEQDALLIGVGPERGVVLESDQKGWLDGNEHHDEVRRFEA